LTNANSNNKQNTLSLADSLTAQFLTKNSTSELNNQSLVNTGSPLCGFLAQPGMTPAASTGHANPERGKLWKILRRNEGSNGREVKEEAKTEGREGRSREAGNPVGGGGGAASRRRRSLCFSFRNFAVKRK
jgi:hypothetical protein